MKFNVGDKVKVVYNSCSHAYIIGKKYYIGRVYSHSSFDTRYRLSYVLGMMYFDTYVRGVDIELVETPHVCKLICKCNPKEAMEL